MTQEENTQKEKELAAWETLLMRREKLVKTNTEKRFRLDSTVLVALIAFSATFLGYLFDSYNKTTQQQREFESTLIINAIEIGNSDSSKNNLKFLIDANLISDKAQQIKLGKIIADSTYKVSKGVSSLWVERDSVFICIDSAASKYHYSKKCRGLNPCKSSIQKVTLNVAKAKFRKPCAYEN
jgi:hypothetical protein